MDAPISYWDSGESSLRIVAWDSENCPMITSPGSNVSLVSTTRCSFLLSYLWTIPLFPVFVDIGSWSKKSLSFTFISNIGKVFSGVTLMEEFKTSIFPGYLPLSASS